MHGETDLLVAAVWRLNTKRLSPRVIGINRLTLRCRHTVSVLPRIRDRKRTQRCLTRTQQRLDTRRLTLGVHRERPGSDLRVGKHPCRRVWQTHRGRTNRNPFRGLLHTKTQLL